MPKFTPRVEPKTPVLHDVSSKKHITFDGYDSDSKQPAMKRAKVDPPHNSNKSESKKRSKNSDKTERKKAKVEVTVMAKLESIPPVIKQVRTKTGK
jgi:hypothetical protein